MGPMIFSVGIWMIIVFYWTHRLSMAETKAALGLLLRAFLIYAAGWLIPVIEEPASIIEEVLSLGKATLPPAGQMLAGLIMVAFVLLPALLSDERGAAKILSSTEGSDGA